MEQRKIFDILEKNRWDSVNFFPKMDILKISKIRKKSSQSRKSRFFKIWCFTCMGAWFWRVQASQNNQKSQKNRSQGHVEKSNDFQTSFSVIWEHFGDPIWGLGTLILGQRGGRTPAPSPSGRDYELFCFFLSVLWPPWGSFNSFLYVFISFTS